MCKPAMTGKVETILRRNLALIAVFVIGTLLFFLWEPRGEEPPALSEKKSWSLVTSSGSNTGRSVKKRFSRSTAGKTRSNVT